MPGNAPYFEVTGAGLFGSVARGEGHAGREGGAESDIDLILFVDFSSVPDEIARRAARCGGVYKTALTLLQLQGLFWFRQDQYYKLLELAEGHRVDIILMPAGAGLDETFLKLFAQGNTDPELLWNMAGDYREFDPNLRRFMRRQAPWAFYTKAQRPQDNSWEDEPWRDPEKADKELMKLVPQRFAVRYGL